MNCMMSPAARRFLAGRVVTDVVGSSVGLSLNVFHSLGGSSLMFRPIYYRINTLITIKHYV